MRSRPSIRHAQALALLLLATDASASAALLPPASLQTGTLAPFQLMRVANAANLSLQILPGDSVTIGGKVSFAVTTRRAGYLILVDVDADGRMSQIFPTPELLAQSGGRDVNLLKPGIPFAVPTAAARQRGFEYIVSPPTGAALMVAILSERRVQLLDLPDLPRKLQGQAEALSYLSTWTSALRVPDEDSGRLMPNAWSFDVKVYSIR
jgi:hypothetical protein